MDSFGFTMPEAFCFFIYAWPCFFLVNSFECMPLWGGIETASVWEQCLFFQFWRVFNPEHDTSFPDRRLAPKVGDPLVDQRRADSFAGRLIKLDHSFSLLVQDTFAALRWYQIDINIHLCRLTTMFGKRRNHKVKIMSRVGFLKQTMVSWTRCNWVAGGLAPCYIESS